MNTQRIRRTIEEALQHDSSSGVLSDAVRKFAQTMGRRISEQDVLGTVDFIKEYVRHVPAFIEEAAKVAGAAGVQNQIAPILKAAEEYFLQPMDIIPDNVGLIGLMDDAYLAHCLLQGVSDNYRARTGKPLFETDLTPANRLIRVLIGEPAVTLLDGVIMTVLNGPQLQRAVQALGNLAGQIPLNVPDPIYGNASIEDIVNVRMGALGIV